MKRTPPSLEKQSNVLLIIDQEITHNLIVFWLNILMAKFRSSHKFSESDYESDNSRILFRITLIQFSEFSKIFVVFKFLYSEFFRLQTLDMLICLTDQNIFTTIMNNYVLK